jgi:hypothetical protein
MTEKLTLSHGLIDDNISKLLKMNWDMLLFFSTSKRLTLAALACMLVIFSACEGNRGLLTQTSSYSSSEKTSSTATAFQLFTDIPIPPGTSFDAENSLILGSGDGWTGRLIVTLSKSPSDAFAIYAIEMPEFGWKPIASVQSDTSVLTFTRGDRAATIQIDGRAITGSVVRITMTPQAKAANP